jgi:hypothetical protein
MHRIMGVAFTVLSIAGAGGLAEAAPARPGTLTPFASGSAPLVETVQYAYRGYRYCWYLNGWRGPGWYRCGFAGRRGYGWGGGYGWRGWAVPGWRGPGWRGGRWYGHPNGRYDRRYDRRRDWRNDRSRDWRQERPRPDRGGGRRGGEGRGQRTQWLGGYHVVLAVNLNGLDGWPRVF